MLFFRIVHVSPNGLNGRHALFRAEEARDVTSGLVCTAFLATLVVMVAS